MKSPLARLSACIVAVVLTASAQSVQAPPDTEIYLASLSNDRGTITVGGPVNISNSPGYDNQPSFTPDGRAILFTSARGSASGETDIYRYDIAARRVVRVTTTAEREYSPTVMPDGTHMSVVRVEADGTQRLWKFTLDGQDPSLVLSGVEPVGYHAWIDENTVALFVLGQPATLQVVSVASGSSAGASAPTTNAEIVARGIGRSLQRMPGGGISFIRRVEEPDQKPAFTIMQLTRNAVGAFEASVLVQPPAAGTEPDLAWAPDGTLITASGGTLFGWRRGDATWRALADLSALGLKNVSRLAVSPSGDRLALVTGR